MERRPITPGPADAGDIDAILAARGSRYGAFPEHALITQALKAVMHTSPNWGALPEFMKEALEMTAHKIGRILNGDPYYLDSWDDIIGYTRLVADEVRRVQAAMPGGAQGGAA
jgi:hypothetical protein